MIKVTFKNVGQGDSIILEWEKNNTKKIGLIDCNLYHGSNPVLDHIIENEYKEIEFLILSHPHYDHFSGILQLLEHFKLTGVRLKNFIHTSMQVPSFIKMAVRSAIATSEIQNLFKFLKDNREKMGINVGYILAGSLNSTWSLSNGHSITFLSPTQKEIDKYIANSFYPFNDSESHDNPSANWLSTVIKIGSEDGFILLTSDADKSSLVRIDKKMNDQLDNKLKLGQSPHHGSTYNHNNTFWKKRLYTANTPIVISVGTNIYKHPSKETLSSFLKNSYKIHSTNKTGGLLDIDHYVVSALNIFSHSVPSKNDQYEGDQVFSIN
jgi:beta-lactamase superfamily II metal-dependent hydrolase